MTTLEQRIAARIKELEAEDRERRDSVVPDPIQERRERTKLSRELAEWSARMNRIHERGKR